MQKKLTSKEIEQKFEELEADLATIEQDEYGYVEIDRAAYLIEQIKSARILYCQLALVASIKAMEEAVATAKKVLKDTKYDIQL